MAQDSVLSLDSYDRRYFDTNDTIETVLTDAYFNKWKRELEVNEMVTVRIGQARHIIRITQINPFVKSSRSTDSYIDSRISAIETGTPVPDPDPAADPTWSLTLADNRLVPSSSVFNFTTEVGAAWAETIDTAVEPTYPDDFTDGQVGTLSAVSGWGVTETRRLYQYDDVNGIVEILTSLGVSGISITAVANTIPLATTFVAANPTDTGFSTLIGTTTCPPDDLTLQYDVVDTNVLDNGGFPTLINSSGSEVIPGIVAITGLTPGTDYSPAIRISPAGNLARAYYSDPSPITTTSLSSITFPAFVLTDGSAVSESHALVDTLTTTGSPDEFYWSLTPIPPMVDSTWIAIPAEASDLDLGAPGDLGVYAYVRLSTDPTNIVAFANNPATVTLVPDSGGDIFSIDAENSDFIISEIGAPTGTLTVVRSAASANLRTVDISSSDGTAIAGVNYKTLNTTLSFESGISTMTVDYDVLLQNIGHVNGVKNERTFNVTLSNPQAAGSINPSNGSATITIQGSNGYIGNDNAIDVNNPPTNLPRLTGLQTPDVGQTYDGYEIDAAGAQNAIALTHGRNNVTFTRCIIRNSGRSLLDYKGWASGLTITNCLVKDWHTDWKSYDGIRWDNVVIKCYPLSYGVQPGLQNIADVTIRGVKAMGHGGFAQYQFIGGGSDNHQVENNHFINTTNKDLGMTRDEYITTFNTGSYGCRDGTFYQIQDNRSGGHSIRDNVITSHRFGAIAGNTMDVINFHTSQGLDEAGRTFVEGNVIQSSADSHRGSSFGLIQDNIQVGGYLTAQYNIFIEMSNGGIALSKENTLARRNYCYCNQASDETTANGVGIDGGNLSGTVEMTDNNIWYYAINPDTLSVRPNHTNLAAFSTGFPPIGWSSQNLQDGSGNTQNWSANGDTILKQVKAVLNNPAIDDGIKVKYASWNCISGNGVLRWDYIDANSGVLYYTAYGDSEGNGVPVTLTADPDPAYGDWQSDYLVYSADTANWIKVIINTSTILAGDQTYKVQVTDFLYTGDTMIMAYDQDTGNYVDGVWAGTDLATVGGTTKPATPTSLAATDGASPGEIDLDWDDMSLPSYRVYRDSVLIASPVTNSFTDTGRTNSVEYSYQVASLSADTPPVQSNLSSPVEHTLTAALDNQLEDLDNDTNWTSSVLVSPLTDNSDGTYTLTNSDAFTGGRYYEFDDGTNPPVIGGNTYRITFSHMNGTGKGRVVFRNSIVGIDYSGDEAHNLDDLTLTEYSYDFTPSGTTLQIMLFVNTGVLGGTTIYTTPTVEDVT